MFLLAGAVVEGVWLATLVSAIRRTDLKDADRIVWTVVLCTLNFLGAVLYWNLAPRPPSRSRAGDLEAERKLKDRFNARASGGPSR